MTDLAIMACRHEFEADWQRACAETVPKHLAFWLRLKADENDRAASELWRQCGESRPGCLAGENRLPSDARDC